MRFASSILLVLLSSAAGFGQAGGPQFAAMRADNESRQHLVHRQRYAMGTMFDVIVYHPSPDKAARAAGLALDEVVRLDRVLSHFDPQSDLARLVRDGRYRFVAVDPDLFAVLRESIRMSRLSGGRFDVTVGPLVHLWKQARLEGKAPSSDAIGALRDCVGFDKIETVEPNRIRLQSACLQLDLGGIGKGYAVDRALEALRRHGIENALVNAGSSSIGAIGTPPGRGGWPVSLGSNANARVLYLRNNSVSTSSQEDEAGELVDPRSAAPVRASYSISVVARSGTLADALSTTLLMVSGDESNQLVRNLDGVTAFWFHSDGRVETAAGPQRAGRSR